MRMRMRMILMKMMKATAGIKDAGENRENKCRNNNRRRIIKIKRRKINNKVLLKIN